MDIHEKINKLSLNELTDELIRWTDTGEESEKLKEHKAVIKEYKEATAKEQAIFNEYSSLYTKARELEKEKEYDQALEIYFKILEEYKPTGTAYYERPCIILEKLKRYDGAIDICKCAIKEIKSNKDFHSTTDAFKKRLDRLRKKKRRKGSENGIVF